MSLPERLEAWKPESRRTLEGDDISRFKEGVHIWHETNFGVLERISVLLLEWLSIANDIFCTT